jgi:hypothetical protein
MESANGHRILSDAYLMWMSAKERSHQIELEEERRHRGGTEDGVPRSTVHRAGRIRGRLSPIGSLAE